MLFAAGVSSTPGDLISPIAPLTTSAIHLPTLEVAMNERCVTGTGPGGCFFCFEQSRQATHIMSRLIDLALLVTKLKRKLCNRTHSSPGRRYLQKFAQGLCSRLICHWSAGCARIILSHRPSRKNIGTCSACAARLVVPLLLLHDYTRC